MRGTIHVPSVYIILRRQGNVAFVLRQNTDFMNGTYSLPAGHVESMETYREAAIREANEEVGVSIELQDLQFVHLMEREHGDHIRMDVFFEAAAWCGEPYNAEPDVHGELAWFPADALPYEKLMDFQAAALRRIVAGDTYSEFGWRQK